MTSRHIENGPGIDPGPGIAGGAPAPHDLAAERAALGAALLTAKAIEELERNFADVPEVLPLIDSLKGADRGIIR